MDHAQKLSKLFTLKKPTIRVLDLFLLSVIALTVINAAKDIMFHEFSMTILIASIISHALLLVILMFISKILTKSMLGKTAKINVMDELGKLKGVEFNISFTISIIIFTLIDFLWFFTLENKFEMTFLFTENIVLAFYLSAMEIYMKRKAHSN